MKYISWNVNGLRAVMRKGFDQIFRDLDADAMCLQETKLSDYSLDRPFGDDIHHYWNNAERKGYSGTAIFTRRQPLSVTMGINSADGIHDHEGRVITADFDTHYLVNVYTPNSQEGLARLDYRMDWEQAFGDYVSALDAVKPVIICGDLNVAHCEIDIRNPKTNHHSAGFTDDERAAMDRLLARGFVDTFRHLHPDEVRYSWWSYRFQARAKNIGWRIDYFLISQRLLPQLRSADILTDILGSDHCPISIDIDL